MKDIEFIKKFSKITVKSVCDEAGVTKSNFWSERISEEKAKEVKRIILLSLINIIKEDLENENKK